MNTFQTTRPLNTEQTIRQLAARHQISHQHSALDHLGDTITQLVDEDVHLDETQWLLMELGRADIISDREVIALNTRYAKEQSEALQV
jgi:hypothetical protein